MINVLYTIPNFKTAGSQFVLLALYQRLDRSLFHPFVLVEKFPDIFPDEIEPDARQHVSEEVGKWSYVGAFARLLKAKKIDVVHSWDYKSNSIEALACRRAGVPYVYTKKNNAWSKRWFVKSLLSTHIVYNNPEMNERFFSHTLLNRKVTFIPHGLDTSVFKPIVQNGNATHFTIGCIGVIGDNKNQLLLLKALRKLPETTKVQFYGKEDATYKAKLVAFIEKHQLTNRVSFNGFVANQDIPKVMANFDVLVLASKNEGLPLSIMEGMACGVPVLSSNSGGGARFLLKDDAGGFIFTSESELVSQLLQLMEDRSVRATLAAKGRERIEENFSITKEVNAYSELYQQIAKK